MLDSHLEDSRRNTPSMLYEYHFQMPHSIQARQEQPGPCVVVGAAAKSANASAGEIDCGTVKRRGQQAKEYLEPKQV